MFYFAKTFVILASFLVGCGQKSSPKITLVERAAKTPPPDPATSPGSNGSDSKTGDHSSQTSKQEQKQERPTEDSGRREDRIKEDAASEIEKGAFQLYYDFKTENKKDCLVASDANQITVAPCSNSPSMGFSFKKIQSGSYQIIAKSTGKCLQVNTKTDYRNVKGQALVQVPCAEATGDSGRFTYNPASQTSKITVMSLCVKLGMVSNAYLDECEVSWTWFTRNKM